MTDRRTESHQRKLVKALTTFFGGTLWSSVQKDAIN